MKILISPAKKMNAETDSLPPAGPPFFLDRAERLAEHLRGLSYGELKKLLSCNDQIARLNYRRYQEMDLHRALTPAILAYEGIQYRYMAPAVFTSEQFAYIQDHLRILSGLYGVLRPFDAVAPYRLEMQAKLKTEFCTSLYDYWGADLAGCVEAEDGTVLDLASEEYSRAVRPHVGEGTGYYSAVFGQLIGGRVVEKGVYVKMARGEMVRWMAEEDIQRPEDIRAFDRMGYRCRADLSDERTFTFVQQGTGAHRL